MIDIEKEAAKIALWQDASSNPDRTNTINAIVALYRRGVAEIWEEAAKIAETIYPPAHTYASENAQIYRAQDETMRKIAAAIRTRAGDG